MQFSLVLNSTTDGCCASYRLEVRQPALPDVAFILIVIDRFYDSIYTERYMGSPQDNAAGYNNASVSHMQGFGNSSFFLAHGSGDDNVHFLNTASLVDKLTFNQIRGWRFRMCQ